MKSTFALALSLLAAVVVAQNAVESTAGAVNPSGADGAAAATPDAAAATATPDWHKPAADHAAITAADSKSDPHNDFSEGFFASFTMIMVTEIGDRVRATCPSASVFDVHVMAKPCTPFSASHHFCHLHARAAAPLHRQTFFIAAIMAMKHSRGVVLAGALSALALMTVLSAGT